jgi:hypothetical protein
LKWGFFDAPRSLRCNLQHRQAAANATMQQFLRAAFVAFQPEISCKNLKATDL